jgi:septal ring factor EnvC (AmiA/AmiB activator)
MNLTEQLEELEASVVRALTTIDELKAQEAKLQTEIQELKKTNRNLTQTLEEKEKEFAAAKALFDARSTELDTLKSHEDVLKEKLPGLLARLAGKGVRETPAAAPEPPPTDKAEAAPPAETKSVPHLRIEPPPIDHVLTEADAPLLHKAPAAAPIDDEDFAPPMPTRKAAAR